MLLNGICTKQKNVFEIETLKILRNFEKQTDNDILARRSDLVLMDKKAK